jgi:hypothetical protein
LEESGVSGILNSYIQKSTKGEICSFPVILKKYKVSVSVICHETIQSLIWKKRNARLKITKTRDSLISLSNIKHIVSCQTISKNSTLASKIAVKIVNNCYSKAITCLCYLLIVI